MVSQEGNIYIDKVINKVWGEGWSLRKGIFILTKLLIKCGMRGGLTGR